MSKATTFLLTCVLLVLAAALPAHDTLGQTAGPQAKAAIKLPDSTLVKYPRVAGFGNKIHIAGSHDNGATYWTKTDSGLSFPGGKSLGSADRSGSKEDYANTSVTTGPDGTPYMAWINQRDGVYFCRVSTNSTCSPKKVVRDGNFRAYVDIAVASDGKILVTWNQDGAFRYRISTDGGSSWDGDAISNVTPFNRPSVAGGPNGSLAVAYGTGGPSGSRGGRIYVSIWNGSGWSQSLVADASIGYNADPDITIAPNGKIYVAWRELNGVYYAERQPNGTWPASRLMGGEVFGTVGIDADAAGNLHMSWANNRSGDWDLYYTMKPANGNWFTPVRTEGGGKLLANASAAGTVSAAIYGHSTIEDWTGSGMSTRYTLYETGTGSNAKPLVEDGATYTNKPTVSVRLTELQGTPNQVRVHWGSAPTDADPWQTFSTSNPVIQVPAPTDLGTDCQTRTLYSQVRSDGGTISPASSDSVVFDTAVQGDIRVTNPFQRGQPLPSTFSGTINTVASGGASDGAPNYTRVSNVYLRIRDIGDCSKLKSYSVNGGASVLIPDGGVGNTVTFADAVLPSTKQIQVNMLDTLNNSRSDTASVIYDPANTGSSIEPNTAGLPVVSDSTTATLKLDSASIIGTLSFSNTSVTDNLYGQAENLPAGKQFWGVWVANYYAGPISSTVELANPNSLVYSPVRVPTPDAAFTLRWNLFNSLNLGKPLESDKDGVFYTYIRFLDGAGNPSERVLKLKTILPAGYRLPTISLPLLVRP